MGVDEGGTVVEGVASDAESVPEREKVHIKLHEKIKSIKAINHQNLWSVPEPKPSV